MTDPRLFALQRDRDLTGVSGTGIVADGCAWPDGTVSIRWRGARPSTVSWNSIADAEAVHGHDGATRIVWALAEPALAPDAPTDEDFVVAVEAALEAQLLPAPGIAVLDGTRTAVLEALHPLVQRLRGGPIPAGGNAEDGPWCVCGDHIEWMNHPDGSGWIHSPGSDTRCLDARPAAPGWADGDPLMEAIAAAVWEHCATEGTSTVRDDPRNIAAAAALAARQLEAPPAADDTTIREALRILLARVQRNALIPGEERLLQQHVEHLLADRDRLAARVATLAHVAAGNKRHVQIIAPELEQAEAALARVRAECDAIDSERDGLDVEEFGDGMADAVARIRSARDGPSADA